MPLFARNKDALTPIKPKTFRNEKELQGLIEANLDSVFSCRFVCSEFPTGQRHGGRIDSLALSEENNPVIIEYKVTESSDLVNQSLFYLSWIDDHRGDFQVATSKALGDVTVDWSDVRVICIAPGYKKYDLHAVEVMGASIELWQYRLYESGIMSLEEVYRRHEALFGDTKDGGKNPVMVAAGKKAAKTRAEGQYTVDEHLTRPTALLRPLAVTLRDFVLNLGDDVEEVPKKFYIAYKVAQNFVCMEIQRSKILLHLKLDPSQMSPLPKSARDMRGIGHYGTGDLELAVTKESQQDDAKRLIQVAYNQVGG
jgi:predicted transport protein